MKIVLFIHSLIFETVAPRKAAISIDQAMTTMRGSDVRQAARQAPLSTCEYKADQSVFWLSQLLLDNFEKRLMYFKLTDDST